MIRCLTLVDIGTETNPNKNWISLMQSISLYCDYEIITQPKKIYRDILGLEFGENYSGFHNVWIFDFKPTKNIKIDELSNVVHHLPIISGLNETIEFRLKCALIDSENKNICFITQ
jgi:hypothetical protein